MDPAAPLTPLQPYTPPSGGDGSGFGGNPSNAPLANNVPAQPVGAPMAGSAMAGNPPADMSLTNPPGVPNNGAGASGIGNQTPLNTPPMGMPPGGTPPIVPGQPYLPNTAPPSTMPPSQPLMPSFAAGETPAAGLAPSADAKNELIEKLRVANNVLVTVNSNPTVDQLTAAIGITLILNRLDKHATAVYSGDTPSTLEFLQPEKTIEKNTDSLRDFIIALDKSKADKLRYKVEDTFVKIFITPYHTSLSESDLEFSQGDFNVDVVLALGVRTRDELDKAITAHGRILHDAVTVSVNNKQPTDLGAINWFQADASSLCEMLVSLIEPLQGDNVLLDEQIATAFLTGVVAETERFSNSKTTPYTMNIAATLMKAGANQQLVSSKLEVQQEVPHEKDPAKPKAGEAVKEPHGSAAPVPTAVKDGSLAIDHSKDEAHETKSNTKTLAELEKENRESNDEEGESDLAKIHIDEEGKIMPAADKAAAPEPPSSSNMIMQPPSLGGAMSSVTQPDTGASQPAVDVPPEDQTPLQHGKTVTPLTEEEKASTLADLEKAVNSPHVSAVDQPTPAATPAPEPAPAPAAPAASEPPAPVNQVIPTGPDGRLTTEDVFPPQLVGPDRGLPSDPTAAPTDPSAPPPVPPPLMPPQ